MLEATRREANELYVLFSLLGAGKISLGAADGSAKGEAPLALVVRREHDGMRRYVVGENDVHIVGTSLDTHIPREDFAAAAEWLLQSLTQNAQSSLDLSSLESFLDALQIINMEAQTDDRTDLHIALWNEDAPLVGLRIQSRLCGYLPLLDGGRTANIKFEQTGVRFSGPAVHKINWTEQPDNVAEVARRILYIQSLGGILKYNDVADKIFKSNLMVLDTCLPRILATMLMTLHLDGTARIDELTAVVEEKNPLKVKDELITKHGLYRYKIRQFLLSCALDMRPSQIFSGKRSAIGGYLMVGPQGDMMLYSRADEQTFGDYLFTHSRLEKVLPDEAKYGYLERENGAYYLKLNLKIGLTKR